MSGNRTLQLYRKNLLAIDAALDKAGGRSLLVAHEEKMSLEDFLEHLAEKNVAIEARCVLMPKPEAEADEVTQS